MSRSIRSTVRSIITSLTVPATAMYICTADAQSVEQFNLPVQPLAESLKAIGLQTKINVMAPPRLVDGLQAPAINGSMTTDQVIARLLGSTDLEFYFVNDRTVVIRRRGETPNALSEAPSADGIRLAQAAAGDGEELQEVVIRGVEFRYPEVQSANKMPMSVKDTPQSVKVVTQDLMEFAGIKAFDDIYKIDASTGAAQTGDHYPRQYYRGFEGNSSGNSIKVDGFRTSDEVSLDLATFERFELVKGPTSTLYGQNAIGGTMNAISKMPKDTAGGEAKVEAGSFDFYRGELDLYGPLGSGSVSYRFVGAYQDAGSYVDFASDDRIVLAPSLKFALGDTGSIIARLNYQRFDFEPYFGFGAQFLGTDMGDPAQLVPDNFRIPDVPRSRSGNAPTNDARKENTVGQLLLDQEIGTWKLRGSAQYTKTDAGNNGVLLFFTDRDGLTDSLAYARDVESDNYSGEVNLFGDFEAGGRKHTLFFGADYTVQDWHLFSRSADYIPGTVSGFSLFEPDYALLDIPSSRADYPSLFQMLRHHEMSGVMAQALLRPADRLTVLLGGRYSHDVERTRIACCGGGTPLDAPSTLEENAFTYQTGLTYALTPQLNVYASHGTTFEPQSGLLPSGAAVDPEEGKAYEIGIKGDVPEHKLSYSAALFHMERTNIAQSIPGTPFLSLIGVQRSKGVEADLQGELLPGWEIYGSVAVMKPEYVEGEYKGVQPANAPKFGLSVFTSYEFQTGQLRGLGFGGGVVHKSGRRTTDLLSFGIPIELLNDITEVELRGFYTRRSWEFELAASNILDEKYYSNTLERLNLGYQVNAPRRITARLRYRF